MQGVTKIINNENEVGIQGIAANHAVQEWLELDKKPFKKLDESIFTVKDDVLTIDGKVGGASSWEDLEDKPFESVDGKTTYIKDGKLFAAGTAKISVSKTGRIATVTAEDGEGITNVYLTDGRDGIDGVDGITPTIEINEKGNWVINSIDTGKSSKGDKGEQGLGFSISKQFKTIDDMVLATSRTPDSSMVVVETTGQLFVRLSDYADPTHIHNGWMEIGGLGDLSAIKGDKGDKGDPGVTPKIDETTKHWMLNDFDTGVVAEGAKGDKGEEGYAPKIALKNNTFNNGLDLEATYKDNSGKIQTAKVINARTGISLAPNATKTGTVVTFNEHTDYEQKFTILNGAPATFDFEDTDNGTKVIVNKDKADAKDFEILNGTSPSLTVEQISDGLHRFTITNADGTKGDSVDINTGYTPSIEFEKIKDGLYNLIIKNGDKAPQIVELNAGYSPTIDIEKTSNVVYKLTKTDKDGSQSIDIYSPKIETEPTENGVKITVSNETGTKSYFITDGANVYNDRELRGRIEDNEAAIEVLTADDKTENSVDYKIAEALKTADLAAYLKKDEIPNTGLTGFKNDGNFVQDSNYKHITVDTTLTSTGTNPVAGNVLYTAIKNAKPNVASATETGVVKVDNTTIKVDSDGTLHSEGSGAPSAREGNLLTKEDDGLYLAPYPIASDNTQGVVSVDNKTIASTNGKVSVILNSSTDNAISIKDNKGLYVAPATDKTFGAIKVDNQTIIADEGVIKSQLSQKTFNDAGFNYTIPEDETYLYLNSSSIDIKYNVISLAGITSVYLDGELVSATSSRYTGTLAPNQTLKITTPADGEALFEIISKNVKNIIATENDGLMLNKYDHIATNKEAGFMKPDNDTVTIDGNGTITAKIGSNSVSRKRGNLIQLLEDGIYIDEDKTVLLASTEHAGKVMPDGDTLSINEETGGLAVNTEVIATQEDVMSLSSSLDAVDLGTPTLVEYEEDELYDIAWNLVQFDEKPEYTEAELDAILDAIDLGQGGAGGGSSTAGNEITADELQAIWNEVFK